MKRVEGPFLIKNDNDQASFRYRQWQTVLLDKGEMIYRIYTPNHNHIIKTLSDVVDPETEQGACWLDSTTYLMLFRAAGGSQYIQSFATRSLLAVKEEWNPSMSRLATAVVQQPIMAAYGLINWQPLTSDPKRPDYDDKRSIMLMGGGYQYFILLKDADSLKIISDVDIRPEANVSSKLVFPDR